jgi:hypothetical protein
MFGTVMHIWRTWDAISEATYIIILTQCLHIDSLHSRYLFHVSWKTIAMFVGLCCIVYHFQCMDFYFLRLPWIGSHLQTWDTLEYERQVILSQRCSTTMILVISPQLPHPNVLISHVNWSRAFQKEVYNFGSLYKFNQRTCTVFWTALM